MSNETKEEKEKLQQMVRDIAKRDADLREKYQIGQKFRFIHDRLTALISKVEEYLGSLEVEQQKELSLVGEDEILVYIYLYNTQGSLFQTWQKMVGAGVLYEYSVNRPIYTEKSHVETFIRTKPNKSQHAYLSIAVKQNHIIKTSDEALKDMIGNPVIKVKEGSLRFEKIVTFTHLGQVYRVNKAGELVRKDGV